MTIGILEIRWHGRGGQGVVTAAQLLALAATLEGKYGVAIPFFGAERRGAPVTAFNRISERKVRTRSDVESPDMVVVVDPSLLKIVEVTKGLKKDGLIVVNSPHDPCLKGYRVAYLDATNIAMKLGLTIAGIPLVNMPTLGALAKASGVVSLKSLERAIEEGLGKNVDLNIRAVRRGAEEVKVINHE